MVPPLRVGDRRGFGRKMRHSLSRHQKPILSDSHRENVSGFSENPHAFKNKSRMNPEDSQDAIRRFNYSHAIHDLKV